MSNSNLYDEKYFKNFLRAGYRRNFHPFNDYKVWCIMHFLHPREILDVGCGSGVLLKSLDKKNIKVYGVDVSKEALNNIPENLRKNTKVGTIQKLPYPDKAFETVVCVDVLEHIPESDIQESIQECSRVAREKIYFDITCLEDILFIHSDNTHVSKFSTFKWGKILRDYLDESWVLRRCPILPFIHHASFYAIKKNVK